MHLYPFTRLSQVPPFWHGLERHSFLSTSQLMPTQPASQRHLYLKEDRNKLLLWYEWTIKSQLKYKILMKWRIKELLGRLISVPLQTYTWITLWIMWAHLKYLVNTASWPTKNAGKISKYSGLSHVKSGWYNKLGQTERLIAIGKSAVSFLLNKYKETLDHLFPV